MKQMCWFHSWAYLRLEQYIDISYGAHLPSTKVYYKCKTCGKIKTVHHYNEKLNDADFFQSQPDIEYEDEHTLRKLREIMVLWDSIGVNAKDVHSKTLLKELQAMSVPKHLEKTHKQCCQLAHKSIETKVY
jgi:hypothetical protein